MKSTIVPAGYSFDIVSAPGRDDLYAELNYQGTQWGEMYETPERDEIRLKIYFVPAAGRKVLKLDFEVDGFIEILESASRKLLRMRQLSAGVAND